MASLAFLIFSVTGSQAQDTNAPAAESPGSQPFFYQDGDTPAVFLGDSVTEQKLYTTLIETFVLSRYPSMKITFRNAGWDGDTAWLARRGDFDMALKRDVLNLKPKVVTIDFGMNDAHGGDDTFSKFLDAETKLTKSIEKAGGRVALLTPTPEERYEPNAPAGSSFNVALKKYIDGLKEVADNEKVPFIDVYTPFVNYIEAGRKAGVLTNNAAPIDPSAVRLTNDGVHPNWSGHFIMAAIILQAMHASPDVSSVALDADAHSIIASQGCQVDWMNSSEGPGVVEFKRTDDCIPWPLPNDPKIDVAMKIPGFDPGNTLNRYMLKVTGLKEAAYTLTVDNIKVGVFTGNDLANGINLSMVKQGPIYDQEQQLLKAVMDKNDAYFERWRNVQLYEMPNWLDQISSEDIRKHKLEQMDTEIAGSEKDIEALRQPATHTFKLVPVPK
jgi:lysophospholipase L1-like esterase